MEPRALPAPWFGADLDVAAPDTTSTLRPRASSERRTAHRLYLNRY